MVTTHVNRMLLCLFGLAALWPASAVAQSASACSQAYETAQEERAAGHLHAALGHLRVCVAPACPMFIREDCARWIDQAEASLPSVVFAVRRDGKDEPEVEITCDGAVVTRALDGKAVAVDPGAHDFLFRMPGFEPVAQRLIIREGERNRMIEVEFHSPVERTPPSGAHAGAKATPILAVLPPSEQVQPARRTAWMVGLAGLGAAGLTSFGVFAALGYQREHDLQASCSPYCSSGSVAGVRTRYVIADSSLGVGLVSLGIATYLYLTGHPSSGIDAKPGPLASFGLLPHPSASGGVLHLSGGF